MKGDITFTWEVDDGYAGPSRPQRSEVPKDDILDCDSVDEAMEIVMDCIKSDFDSRISPSYSEAQFRKQIEEVFAEKEADE